MKHIRHITLALCVICSVVFASAAFAAETPSPSGQGQGQGQGRGQGRGQGAAPSAAVGKVAIMDMSQFIESTGSVEASRIAQLASPAEGPITESNVQEGDTVGKGAILVRIGRTRSAEAFLQSAFEDLKKEEQETRNVQQLVTSGAIPAEQLTIARANLQKARAQAAKLRESLEDFNIKAPWDGIVSKVLVREGNFVAPRMTLAEMYDPASLVVRFAVPEAQAALVRNGLPVSLKLDAYPDANIKATITRVYPELDRKTRTLTVEATPETDLVLKPGMFARLKLQLQSAPDALAVPSEAVRTNAQNESFVIVTLNGKTERRPVTLGVKKRDYVEILSGAALGEEVLLQGEGAETPASLAATQNQRQR